jgi:hypothetical protein
MVLSYPCVCPTNTTETTLWIFMKLSTNIMPSESTQLFYFLICYIEQYQHAATVTAGIKVRRVPFDDSS